MTTSKFRYSEPFDETDIEGIRFRRQWIIHSASSRIPRFNDSIQLNSRYQLDYHPDLRLSYFHLADAGLLILGIAVDCQSPEKDAISRFQEGTLDLSRITRELETIAGTYVVVYYSSEDVYIFTDPMGMMGVYYGEGCASSTPALIPNIQRDNNLDVVFPFGGSNEWYPGSLLPFQGVKYLLANHFLALSNGIITRFWPPTEFDSIDRQTGTEMICEQLQRMVRGVVCKGNVVASLSGGKDSRSVLAASRELHQSIEYFTLFGSAFDSQDYKFAGQIAENHNLNHHFIEVVKPEPWLVELYDEMTGGLVCGAARLVAEAIRSNLASSTYIHMNGAAGEICSPFYWHSKNPKNVRIGSLMRKHGSKPPEIRSGFLEWLATVEHFSPTTVYNLMFAEQIEGRWQGISETASSIFYESFSPYCNRDIIMIICSLPNSVVYENKLRFDVVRRMWPELLDVRYTTGFPLSKYVPRAIKDKLKFLLNKTFRSYVRDSADTQHPRY